MGFEERLLAVVRGEVHRKGVMMSRVPVCQAGPRAQREAPSQRQDLRRLDLSGCSQFQMEGHGWVLDNPPRFCELLPPAERDEVPVTMQTWAEAADSVQRS